MRSGLQRTVESVLRVRAGTRSVTGRSKNDRPVHLLALGDLDVARAHQCSTARRNGAWEFLETPELRQAKLEIEKLNGALDIPSKPFPGYKSLTPRERIALAQIVRGASSKEAARRLGISPRTVEFHRANVMRKLGAKNTADLVRRVLGE
jgi:DNA-binding CsgD family transcriptional regulator